MSKLKKIIATGALVVVSAFSYIGGAIGNIAKALFPVGSASASSFNGGNKNDTGATTSKAGSVVTVTGLTTSVSLGEPVSINYNKTGDTQNITAKAVGGDGNLALSNTNLFIEVLDPFGASLTEWKDSTMKAIENSGVTIGNGTLTLVPNTSGRYTVKFHVLNGGVWTSTGEYSISVSCSSYEMKMASNDTIPMPTSFKTGVTGKESQNISLPLVYDENGELVKDQKILLNDEYIVEYKDVATSEGVNLTEVLGIDGVSSSNVYSEYNTYTIRKKIANDTDCEYKLEVAVVTSGDNDDVVFDSTLGEDEKNYETIPASFKVAQGKNVVTYVLKNNENKELAKYTHTITGSAQYASDKIELTATLDASSTSSFAYKKKVYLSEVAKTTVVNSNNKEENLPYFGYYVIEEKVGTEYKVTTNVKMGRDENGFWFEPQGEKDTTYRVTYLAIDAFGNTSNSNKKDSSGTFTSDRYFEKSVSDNIFDSYAFTSSYDMDRFDKADYVGGMEDATYLLASKVSVKVDEGAENPTITIPALWGYDKSGVSEAYRQLVSSSATFISTSSDKTTENKTATFNLTSNSGVTMGSSSINMPFTGDTDGDNNETRKTFNDYVTFKNGGDYYYEDVKTRGNDSIGDIIKCTSGTTHSGTYYVYFYGKDEAGNKGYFKSTDGTRPTEDTDDLPKVTDTDKYKTATVTEIRNFKNSCEIILEIDPALFGAGTYKLYYYLMDGSKGSGYVKDDTTLTFEVVSDEITSTTPTVKFGDNTVGNVDNNQVITVSTPEIKDQTDSRLFVKYYAVVGDKVKLISSGLASDTDIEFNTNMTIDSSTLYDLAKDNGKSFKVVALAFNSFADRDVEYVSDWETNADIAKTGIGVAEVNITIKDTSDTLAPTFYSFDTAVGGEGNAIKQNKSYSVKGLTFYDNSETVDVLVEITDTQGRVYDDYSMGAITRTKLSEIASPTPEESGATTAGYTDKFVFDGITFTPTNADEDNYYTVTYKLVDSCDNVTSFSFVLIHVTDTTPPVITLNTEKRTVELGQSTKITFETKDSSTVTSTVKCTDANGSVYNYATIENGNVVKFDGKRVGTYTLTITSEDLGGYKSSRAFTVEVKDSNAPVITVLNETGSVDSRFVSKDSSGTELAVSVDLNPISETDAFAVGEDGVKTTSACEVTIPVAIINDVVPTNALSYVNGGWGATGRLTVTTPNKDTKGLSEFVYDLNGNLVDSSITNTLNLHREGNVIKFTPFGTNFRGEYTFVYSGTDSRGNSAATKTMKLSIGDTEKPQIYLTSSFEATLSKGFVLGENDTLTFNPNAKIKGNTEDFSDVDIYVSDNLGFAYKTDGSIDKSADKTVEVGYYVTDPSGSTLSKETNTTTSQTTYKFTKTGTYTITFYVTDVSGNRSESKQVKFVVKAKTTSSVDASTIIGTVLIVVSALILAGIVVYLVRGVKLLPKKNKKTSKKADKKTEEKVED